MDLVNIAVKKIRTLKLEIYLSRLIEYRMGGGDFWEWSCLVWLSTERVNTIFVFCVRLSHELGYINKWSSLTVRIHQIMLFWKVRNSIMCTHTACDKQCQGLDCIVPYHRINRERYFIQLLFINLLTQFFNMVYLSSQFCFLYHMINWCL